MKKKHFLSLLLAVILAGCMHEQKQSFIDLNVPWKFKPGDNLAWAAPTLDEKGWDSILPSQWWEEQGHQKLNGFAWYRIKVIIPSSLKKDALVKDSLQFLLGKIDDCDQVFLNGELAGENSKTIPGKVIPDDHFTKISGYWDVDRRYVLPVSDARIQWDKENVIAIRVFDKGGAGGLFSKPFRISMVDLQDYIKFDFTKSAFSIGIDSTLGKTFTIQNISGNNDFKGKLSICTRSYINGNTVFSKDTTLQLLKNSKKDISFSFKNDISRPVFTEIRFTEEVSGHLVTERLEVPYILTPKSPDQPRINGAGIFGVRLWSPFLFRVAATGKPPLKYSATGLPKGLRINKENGIITGGLSKKGTYVVKLKVENEEGSTERDFRIVVGDRISLTPPLGWNSWNCWGLSVSDEKVRKSAEFMNSSGLSGHGWTYINIDDGWEDTHDKKGNILPNSKFPDMKALCSYIHSIGLKAGIYSSPGTKTCGGYEGSYTYEEKDAQAYANWGIDYLKYDWCSYGRIAPDPTAEQLKHPYEVMKRAIRKVNRDIHYSLCQYGMGNVWEWGGSMDANSWRTTGDIEDTWESLSGIGFSQDKCSPYAAPGRWNDPDMLVVGWVGWGPSLHNTHLTPGEQYTHISLWCLLSAPLLIGCDLSQIDPFTMNLLANDEVLAVNQDPLGKQARQIKANQNWQIWEKDLEDGSKAIGIFNLTDQPLNIPVDTRDLNITGRYELRDLWRQKDLGYIESHFEMSVNPHGAALMKLLKSPGHN